MASNAASSLRGGSLRNFMGTKYRAKPCHEQTCMAPSGALCRTGQHDSEQAAFPFIAFELYPPAVRLDRPARDGEPEPHPARVARPALVHAIKALEYPLPMSR